MAETKIRCSWAGDSEIYIQYHDEEWGVESHGDRYLFEMINLEGAQAGLSWLTILKKRPGYRLAFDNFNAKKIAKYDDSKRSELLNNPGIVRNRLKINAAIENAKAYLVAVKEYGSFDKYIWSFSDYKKLTRHDHQLAHTISEAMSKDLKKRGFRFVGPTICYGFMQAIGMINDHQANCFKAISS